jgi:hypothetical protein
MKALIWKECRENLKWTVLPAVLILGPMGLFGPASLMAMGYLFHVSLVAAVFGAVLGFLQVFPESHGDKRSLLLHRPLSRSQIFLGKAIAGGGLYLLALGIPLACAVALAATPGNVPEPFGWPMMLPWLADSLTGLVWYFAGMLTAQREARWYGSRCLGLAAGLFCSIAVWIVPEFWQALLAIVLMAGVVAVAAWGSFLAGGAYAPQPRRARIALAMTFLAGLSALGFMAKVLLGRHLEPGTRYAYMLDRQGRLLDLYTKDGAAQGLTDPDGQVPPEFQGAPLDLHAIQENTAPQVRVDLTQRRSYRHYNRSHVKYANETKPGSEVWWYVPDQGRLLGYDMVSKRPIGSFGPDGFVPPGGQVGGRFAGQLYHFSRFPEALVSGTLAFPNGVYTVDFHKRTVQTLFLPSAGETVLWSAQWEDKKRNLSLAFVGTDRSVLALDAEGSRLFSTPVALDPQRYRIRSAGRLENPQRYWVWYEPQWYLGVEALQAMPAYVVEYDGAGHETARRTVPPRPDRPGDARDPDPRALVFEPPSFVGLSGLVTPPAEFAILVGTKQYLLGEARANDGAAMSLLLPFFFFATQFFLPAVGSLPRTPDGLVACFWTLMLLSAAACALACFLLTRRHAFSGARCVGWTVCGFLWGPTGLLLLLALQDWPARIPCPKCRKPRVVTRDTCEHCGAPHAAPAPDGTEIFEEIAQAPHEALAGL